MRLWSTRESVRGGEPSLLAIVETLAAMAASVWIGVHFGTWMHLAIGACVSPFLLLRTDASCKSSVRFMRRWWDRVDLIEGIIWFGGLVTLGVAAAIVRFLVTLTHVCVHPVQAARAFPTNWWRTAVSTDSAISPEWLPLTDESRPSTIDDDVVVAIAPVYRLIRMVFVDVPRSEEKWTGRILWTIVSPLLLSPLLIVCLFSGLAYRWSIKSTALVWAPMLWALKPAKPAYRDWKTHLSIESDLKKPQFVAVLSVASLTLLAVKYALWAGQHQLATHAEALRDFLRSWGLHAADSPMADAIIAWVRPGAIPLWQVAVFVNSLLGLWVWWKFRDWLAHFKHDLPPTDRSIGRMLAVTFFFRHLLTSYVIICNGYIALQLARKLPVPEIGSKLFPWI